LNTHTNITKKCYGKIKLDHKLCMYFIRGPLNVATDMYGSCFTNEVGNMLIVDILLTVFTELLNTGLRIVA